MKDKKKLNLCIFITHKHGGFWGEECYIVSKVSSKLLHCKAANDSGNKFILNTFFLGTSHWLRIRIQCLCWQTWLVINLF